MTVLYISETWLTSCKISVKVSYLCRAVRVASHVGKLIFPQFVRLECDLFVCVFD